MTATRAVDAYPGLVAPRPHLVTPRRPAVSVTLRVAGPLVLVGAWWIASAAGALNPAVLSSPEQVAKSA